MALNSNYGNPDGYENYYGYGNYSVGDSPMDPLA